MLSYLIERLGFQAMSTDGATWGRDKTVMLQCCWSGALCTLLPLSRTHRTWLQSLSAAPSRRSDVRSNIRERAVAGGPMRWSPDDVCARAALSMGGGT